MDKELLFVKTFAKGGYPEFSVYQMVMVSVGTLGETVCSILAFEEATICFMLLIGPLPLYPSTACVGESLEKFALFCNFVSY